VWLAFAAASIGWSALPDASIDSQAASHAHNVIIDLVLQVGVIGLILWLCLPHPDGEEQEKAGRGPASLCCRKETSDRLNVRRLLSLRALRDLEAYLLTFLQRFEPRHVDRREVGEQIFAAPIGRNKAEALRIVEPLNRSSWHVFQS